MPGLVISIIKACAACRFGTNTENPYQKGVLACKPCLPWGRGDHIEPEGDFCHPCVQGFELSSLKQRFPGGLREFKVKLKTTKGLPDESMAVRTSFIRQVNDGSVPPRMRGLTRDKVCEQMDEDRKKHLDKVAQSRVSRSQKFKEMTRKRYKDTHEGREPEDDGHEVVEVCGQKFLDTVWD